MVDPLSSLGIAAVAFLSGFVQSETGKKFIEGIIGKLGEKVLDAGLEKTNQLRRLIVSKLSGNANAERALEAAEQGNQKALEDVADYLKVAMKEDEEFASQVQAIVKEINIGVLEESNQVQNQTVQSGGIGYQTQTGHDNTNFIGGTHYHGEKP
jgi:hypothetical protein